MMRRCNRDDGNLIQVRMLEERLREQEDRAKRAEITANKLAQDGEEKAHLAGALEQQIKELAKQRKADVMRSSQEIESATLEEMRARHAAEQALSLERKRREGLEEELVEERGRASAAERRARDAEAGLHIAEEKARLAERQLQGERERAEGLERQLAGAEGSGAQEIGSIRRMYEQQMEGMRDDHHAKMRVLEQELRLAREQAVQSALKGAKESADQTLSMRELELSTLRNEMQRMKELVQVSVRK